MNGAIKILAWLSGLLFFLILIVLPLLAASLFNIGIPSTGLARFLAAIEQLQSWTMQLFLISWFFFVGGCFASFLNVVAWRVPRGKSILGSSHCPNCQTRLAFSDNLPIVGWLRNSGRCRTCQAPISPRYLIGEIVLGSVFLLLTLVELAAGGWNLPFRPLDKSLGFENLLLDPQWDLIRPLIYHLVLMSTLFLFSLVEAEYFRIPRSLFLLPLVIGIVAPLIWTDVWLVSWNGSHAAMTLGQVGWGKCLTLLLGTGIGFCLGWWRQFLLEQPTVKRGFNAALGMMLVGLFLGWQAAVTTTIIYLTILLLEQCLGLRENADSTARTATVRFWNPGSRLMLATMLQLLTWGLQTGKAL